MATPVLGADNLKIAQELLATMAQVSSQLNAQTETYRAQAKLVEALCQAQDCFTKLDPSKVKEITDALKEAQESTKDYASETEKALKNSDNMNESVKKLAEKVKKLSVPKEFLNGFKAGLHLTNSLFGTILRMGATSVGILANLGKALLSIPGRIMDFFQNAAGGGADPYRQALEKLRAEYGNLSIGTSKAIQGMMPNLKNFEQSGLRLSRVFGYGREGAAKALLEFMKIAQEIGPLGRRFMESTKNISDQVMVLSKAGMGSDMFRSLQQAAENGGESVESATKNMVKDVARAERGFGISSRELMKDMTEITKGFASFGVMSREQMLTTSVYVKKLGISIETLKKTVDKSLNFESAAEQAAKLAEGFNIALDPMKQLREQDPTKKLDNIRQAFFKTGKNIDQMSVAERSYFASLAGVSEEEARTVFAQKNRALSGEQLRKQMHKEQKTQISQAEAMKTLAQSIERLVQSGSAMKGGFMEMFFKGFERGIRRTKEFREVVHNMQRSLRAVYYAGIQVGRMFVHMFPGVLEMLRGLASAFDPRRFRVLMGQVVEEFRRFFKLLQTDPKAGFRTFMKNMKDIFFNFFTKGAPAGARFLDGLKTYLKTIGIIMVEGLRYSLDALRNVLHIIIDTIKNPGQLQKGAADIGEGISGMFAQAFLYLKAELGPIVSDIGTMLVDLMKHVFEHYIRPHLAKLFAAYFGPALFFGVARAAGAALLQTGFTAIFSKFFKQIPQVPGTGGAGGPGGAAGAVADAGKMGGGLMDFGKNLMKIALAMIVIALAVRILMPLIISIAREIDKSGVSKESLVMTVVVLGLVGGLFVAIGGMLKTIKEAEIKPDFSLVKTLAIVGVTILGLIGIAWVAIKALGGFPAEEVGTAMFALAGVSAIFAGVGVTIGILARVGKLAEKSAGQLIVGIFAAGAIILAMTAAAWVAIKALGGFSMEQIGATLLALGGMAILFGGIGLLIAQLIFIGTGIGLSVGGAFAAIGLGLVAVVGVLVVIGAAAAAAIAALGGFPKEKVESAMLAMTAMTAMFGAVALSVGLLIGLASLFANPFALAGLALSLVAVYAAFEGIISVAKDFLTIAERTTVTKEKAEAVGIIMENVGKLLTAIVESMAKLALVGRSSVMGFILGADFSGSFGTIKDMLVGENGDGGIMKTMQTMIKGILRTVNNLTGDPAQLKAKAEVFSIIAEGISALLKPISEVIEAVSGLLFAGNPDAEMRQVIALLLGDRGFLGILLKENEGFIPKLIDQLSRIDVSQGERLKTSAEVFKSITGGIAEVVKVLPAMIKATTDLADEIPDSDVINTLNAIKGVIVDIISHVSGLVVSLGVGLTGLLSNPAVSPEKLKAASAVGDIMRGVGEVLKALIPSPDTVKAFQSVQDNMGGGSTYSSGIDSTALTTYMNNVMSNLTRIIGNDTSGIMGMIRSIATMSITPDQIEKLKGIAPIMAAIGDLINHLTPSTEILNRITVGLESSTVGFGGMAAANRRSIGYFMDRIKDTLNVLLPTIKSFISDIADKLNTLNPASIEGLKAISPILNAVGSLISNVMPSATILDRITQTSSDSLSSDQLTTNQKGITDYFTAITGYLNNLFLGTAAGSGMARDGGIIGLVKTLADILSGMPIDETRVKALNVFGGLITSVANMIVPIMNALQTFGANMAGRDAGTIYQQGQQMTGIITAVANAISTIFTTTLPALVRSISTMELPRSGVRDLEARTKAIKGIFDIVSSLSTIISGFKLEGGTGGDRGGFMNMYHDVFNPIISLLEFMFTGVDGARLRSVISALSGEGFKSLSGIEHRAKGLKSLFEAISTVATSAKTLKETFHGEGTNIRAGDLDAGFDSINNSLAPFRPNGHAAFLLQTGRDSVLGSINTAHANLVGSGRNAKGIGDKLEEIKKQISAIKTNTASLGTEMTGITTLSNLDSNFTTLQNNISGILTSLDTFVHNVETRENEGRIGRILGAIGNRSFLGEVRQAVEAYGNFSRDLAQLTAQIGGQSFDVSLNRLGATLEGNAARTISNAAANIQVNVNVHLEARQVAGALWTYSNRPSSTASGGAPPPGGFMPGTQRGLT
jgi:hypothetical protein